MTYNKRSSLSVIAFLLAASFSSTAVAIDKNIAIPNVVEYFDKQDIDNNIQEECLDLNKELADNLNRELKNEGFMTTVVSSQQIPKTGQYLDIKLTDVISGGNAFIGHRKMMSVKINLFSNGEKIATRKISDTSNGGISGGFKGSCAVLGALTIDLSEKVAEWLKDFK